MISTFFIVHHYYLDFFKMRCYAEMEKFDIDELNKCLLKRGVNKMKFHLFIKKEIYA